MQTARAYEQPRSLISPLEQRFDIDLSPFKLSGTVCVPDGAVGLVVFANGSGFSCPGPEASRARVAFHARGLATMAFDLVSTEEEIFEEDADVVPDNVSLLAGRVAIALDWAAGHGARGQLPMAMFAVGASASAAFIAAAERGSALRAVASLDGDLMLAAPALPSVLTPVLLVVAARDDREILSDAAAGHLSRIGSVDKTLHVVLPHRARAAALTEALDVVGAWMRARLAAS